MKNPAADTRWLTHASFAPAARRWGPQQWALAGAAALLLLAAAGSSGPVGDMFATAGELAAVREERAALMAEVERLRTQLALEGATRGELEQHSAELNAQVAELTRQVDFLTARKTAVARAN